jgi:Zn-dependent peptidase ImmA (M78 family)
LRRLIGRGTKGGRPVEQYNEVMPKRYDADVAAGELLEECWDGSLPIDPVRVAQTLGVKVLDAPLNDDVSGALVKEKNADPSILLNASDSKNRKRFTCAHELGHFIRRADEPEKYEYVDYRDERSSTGTVEEERFANGFAANLLMPELLVKSFHDQKLPDFRMARMFGVSQEAMHFRLKNLGLSE